MTKTIYNIIIIEQKFEKKNGVKIMKTNLSNLMNIVVEEERKFSAYGYELKNMLIILQHKN